MSAQSGGVYDEIRTFLLSYCAAFNRFDSHAVTTHYALPAQIATKEGQVTFRTLPEAESNSSALVAMYKNWGFSEARLDDAHIELLGEVFASANVQWEVSRRGKLEPWRFRTHYTLSRTSGHWKIIQAVAFQDMRMHPLRGSFAAPSTPP